MSKTPHGLLPPPSRLLEGQASLFLDFDGTLVDFADRHDGVIVGPHVAALLAALGRRLNGRIAIVSGRPASEIRSLLCGDETAVDFAIAGSHGLEIMWPDGRVIAPPPPASLAEASAAFHEFAAETPGVVIEDKPFGVALHFRQAPSASLACEALATAIASSSGLSLQHGKMVCELRAEGADKGDAVRALLAEPPMMDSIPIFLGDDLTDEAGFQAAEAVGGIGILIGDREGFTAARYALPDVAAVHGWLGSVAEVSA